MVINHITGKLLIIFSVKLTQVFIFLLLFFSQAFNEYVKSRGYNLLTVPEYGKVLESVGFIDVSSYCKKNFSIFLICFLMVIFQVEAKDITNPYFIGVLKREMSDFTAKKADIIKEFSQKDYDYIINGKKQNSQFNFSSQNLSIECNFFFKYDGKDKNKI